MTDLLAVCYGQGDHIRFPLPEHCGVFDFEEQVFPADVADDRYPGPADGVLVSVENLFDPGCLAIGDYMYDVLVAAVHITEHGADVLDGCLDLARGVADMRGLAVGINRCGAGDEYRMARRRGCLRSPREGRAVLPATLLFSCGLEVRRGAGRFEQRRKVHRTVASA